MHLVRACRYIVPFIAALTIISCHKSSSLSPQSPYFLHCTIDGVDLKLDSGLVAIKSFSSSPGYSYSSMSVSGMNGRVLGQQMEFSIQNNSTAINNVPPQRVGVGSYGVNNHDFHVYMGYNIAVPPSSYVADDTGLAPDTSNFFTINITAFDSVGVKGNFSGKVYTWNYASVPPPHPYGPAYKTITNGTFYVAWK